MPRTLTDLENNSIRAKSEPVRRARAVLDQTYAVACQVLELREQRGLSQSELATASGVPQSQISRIERGTGSPTVATLAKVAAVLNAEVRLVVRVSD